MQFRKDEANIEIRDRSDILSSERRAARGRLPDDFRDHIATADEQGRRKWLYPKHPRGRFYRARTWLTWLLLAVMFGGPLVKIHGNPLLMVNIVERKFSVLGVIFWPQDNLV